MTKVLLIVGVVTLASVGLILANGIYGNPFSKALAKNTVQTYMEKTYNEEDFIIDNLFYNFKDGYYHAEVLSPSSIDTHFIISTSSNEIAYDGYENEVLSGWNTYIRIDNEYRQLVNRAFSSTNFPLKSDIDFGTIPLLDDNFQNEYNDPDYGLKLEELTLDEQYDIQEIGKKKGHITFYAQDEDISFDKASELLLSLKHSLDQEKVPFYGIDFILEKPRTEEEIRNEDDPSIQISQFRYTDIEEEGLAERIKEAHEELMAYYAAEDAKIESEEEK